MTIEKRNKLIMSVYYFCLQQAGRYACHKYEKEDAMQDALAGAIEAAERFDDTKGVPFIGYARAWVQLYLSNGISERVSSCKMPKTSTACMYYNAMKIVDECGIDEAAKRYKVKPRGLIAYMDAVKNTKELSEISNTVQDMRQETEWQAIENDLRNKIMDAMKCLNTRERDMVRKYFWDGKNLAEVGAAHGVSYGRAQQIIARAAKKMQVRAWHLRDFMEG